MTNLVVWGITLTRTTNRVRMSLTRGLKHPHPAPDADHGKVDHGKSGKGTDPCRQVGLALVSSGWLAICLSPAIAAPPPVLDPPVVDAIGDRSPTPITTPTHPLTHPPTPQPPVSATDNTVTDDPMAQITGVTQLADIAPTDWAFEALRSLVERYGCIQGYPTRLFNGKQALSRAEFAAGLNACLSRLSELIAQSTADAVRKEDLVLLQKLQEQFAAELATLRGRVDVAEARISQLQADQFSPTTKLFGQVVTGLQVRSANQADFFPVDGVKDARDPATNANVITNAQFSLVTQFSPNSLLLTGLQAGIGSTAPRLTNDTRLGYEGPTVPTGSLVLSDLTYRHRFGKNFAIVAGAAGVNMVNVFRGANRVESAGFGPLSAFAQRNPILSIGAGQGGVGFDWQFLPRASMQAVYSAGNPSNPTGRPGNSGILGGRTTFGLQFTFAPRNNLDLAIHYVNAYSPNGSLNTRVGDDQLSTTRMNTNAVGATLSWRALPSLVVGGWLGYTTSAIPGEPGSVETNNWMLFFNFPNLFRRGNLGGIYIGQPPRISSSNLPIGENIPDLLTGGLGRPGAQPSSTLHLEAFYRWRLSRNISLTPGVIVILDPAHTASSDPVVIGALRTTFSF